MIGSNVSHYRIISHIGAGGMGTVYLAEDTKLKRRVALKFLSPGMVHDSEAAARLLREARAASALNHPRVGTVYEISDHDGQPFIAMAHFAGETLAAVSRTVRCLLGRSRASSPRWPTRWMRLTPSASFIVISSRRT